MEGLQREKDGWGLGKGEIPRQGWWYYMKGNKGIGKGWERG
jgi:hypothetical protein